MHLRQRWLPSSLCRQCLARQAAAAPARRFYSTTQTPVAAPLPSRRLLSVAGPDAAKYLQGVITANMQRLRDVDGLYAGFLNAQGRVLHDVFVYRDRLGTTDAEEDAFLVEVDAAEAATLAKHIKRYKLRARFAVRVLDADELAVWQRWGGGDEGAADGDGRLLLLRDGRAPGMGWRCLVRPGSAAATSAVAGGVVAGVLGADARSAADYRVHRYLRGVAEGAGELVPGQALPLESNLDLMGGIDFRKGCYVGQELTIRTRHRGVVRKRILPCIVYGEGEAVPQTLAFAGNGDAGNGDGDNGDGDNGEDDRAGRLPPLASIARVGKKGRSAGKWLAGVGNLGLALCRLETMTDLVLPGEAAAVTTAAAAADPATAEFVVGTTAAVTAQGEGDMPPPPLKVRAFVPDWLREGLAASTR